MYNKTGIGIYPNPAKDHVIVSYFLDEKSDVKIVLYDGIGREIKILLTKNENSGEHSLNIDVSELNDGIYFIKAAIGKAEQTEKIIINKN
jgi:hypothetical protein